MFLTDYDSSWKNADEACISNKGRLYDAAGEIITEAARFTQCHMNCCMQCYCLTYFIPAVIYQQNVFHVMAVTGTS